MTLAAFLTFAGLVTFAAISPGPAVLMAARTGLTEGAGTVPPRSGSSLTRVGQMIRFR